MQGQTAHVPLTELGHAQAAGPPGAELAAPAGPARWSPATCSARCRPPSTAPRHRPAAATTPELREQGYGVLEGRPSRELWDVVDWTDPHWVADGGESLAQLHGRVAATSTGCGPTRPPRSSRWSPTATPSARPRPWPPALGPDAMPAVTPANGSVTRLELR